MSKPLAALVDQDVFRDITTY